MTKKTYTWILYQEVETDYNFTNNLEKLAIKKWYKSVKDAKDDTIKNYSTYKHNPFLMEDMDKLIDRLVYHIKNKNNILVFWDYDVDGISASAVILKWLTYMWVKQENLQVIIPNRNIWYSIKKEYIIEHLKNNGKKPDVILTVDCGIRNVEDVKYIVEELWIEVLVSDHHWVDDDNLPLSAKAIVNPHRRNSKYPFQEISWSLVALKVIEALNTKLPFIDWYNKNPNNALTELEELALLGTIADVMPIFNENKWLAKTVLPRLSQSKNLWLLVFTNELKKNLQESAEDADYNTDFIWWAVWPRINAAWRIDNPYIPLQLLLTNDVSQAKILYTALNETNIQRQEIVQTDYEIARKEYIWKKNINWIVYVNKETKDGIIWLIAWKLKEDFNVPTIVLWAINNGIYKWSCRSINGFNIYEILNEMNNYYVKNISKSKDNNLMLWFWGHPLAAWLSIEEAKIKDFIEIFNMFANKIVTEEMKKRQKEAIWGLVEDYSVINLDLFKNLKDFWPFGQGNEEPNFVVKGKIEEINIIWKTAKTVKIILKDSKWNKLDALNFNYKITKWFEVFVNSLIKEFAETKNLEVYLLWKFKKNNFIKDKPTINLQFEDILIPNK